MTTHAEWFAELGRNAGTQPVLAVLPGHGEHGPYWACWLRFDGPFPTRKGAELSLEHARREIADLIAIATGVSSPEEEG